MAMLKAGTSVNLQCNFSLLLGRDLMQLIPMGAIGFFVLFQSNEI